MRLTKIVHYYLQYHIKNNSIILDATAGNGYDTKECAGLISTGGLIIAVDKQMEAINRTKEKLKQAKLDHLCRLICGDHKIVLAKLSKKNFFDAIIFNLGYLPRSCKTIKTSKETTIPALNDSLRLLKDSGLLFITAYKQHKGGLEEHNAISEWIIKKHKNTDNKFYIKMINSVFESPTNKNDGPTLWICSKKPLNLPKIPLQEYIF